MNTVCTRLKSILAGWAGELWPSEYSRLCQDVACAIEEMLASTAALAIPVSNLQSEVLRPLGSILAVSLPRCVVLFLFWGYW